MGATFCRTAEGNLERVARRVVDADLADDLTSLVDSLKAQGRLMIVMANAIDRMSRRAKSLSSEDVGAIELTITRIINATCRHFHLLPKALVGSSRSASVVRARHVAMLICRRREFSFPEIGRAMNRDHSSVMSAVKPMEKLVDGASNLGKSLRCAVTEIEATL